MRVRKNAKNVHPYRRRGALVFKTNGKIDDGAQERTRTSTSIQTLAPEASASTNSATWAGVVSRAFKPRRWGCQMDSLASAAAFFLVDGFMDGARMISMATASFEKLRNL